MPATGLKKVGTGANKRADKTRHLETIQLGEYLAAN